MQINNINQLLDFHKKFAEDYIIKTRSFTPQIVIMHEGNIIPIAIAGDQSLLKDTISMIENNKEEIDWIIMMYESYMGSTKKDIDELKKFEHGSLEERYLAGDQNIKWTFTMQAYWKDKKEGGKEKEKWIKKMRVYEIKTVSLDLELLYEIDDFIGYLTINLEDGKDEDKEKILRDLAKLFAKEYSLKMKFIKNKISEKELISEVRKLGFKIEEGDEQKYIDYMLEKERKGGETEEELKERAITILKDLGILEVNNNR